MNTKIVILFFALALIVACSVKPAHRAKQELHIDELIIRNLTETVATNIELRVVDTGRSVSCSMILAQSMCSLGFQTIPLEEHTAYLSWHQNDAAYSELVKSRSIPLSLANAKVYINILDQGQLHVSVE